MFGSIFKQFRHYRVFMQTETPQWWVTAFLVVMLALVSTLMIWMISKPIDAILQQKYTEVFDAIMAIAVLVVFSQLLHFVTTLSTNAIGLRLVGRLRNFMLGCVLNFTRYTRSPWEKGDILTRISHDVDKVQELVVELPMLFLSHVVTFVLYLTLLFFINWQLSLIALAVTPLFLLHQWYFGPRKKHAASQFLKYNGHLLAQEDQTLSNAQLVNTLLAENTVLKWHQQKFSSALKWAMRERWLDSAFSASFALLVFLSVLLIVGAAVEFIQQGQLSLGQLSSFLLYLGYMAIPVRGFAQAPFVAQVSVAAAERLREMQQISQQIAQAAPAEINSGTIEISELNFAYDGKSIFRDFNLQIPHGQFVAVVGPSGVGKSSLLKLMMGFLQAQSGHIYLDGKDISALDHADVLKAFAVVWQMPFVFNQTVRENLLLAKHDATEEELRQACEYAGAWGFIAELAQGLDTLLGELGLDLSAGQKQRLAIAQAFLKPAPIVLMDEPSAALDSESEQHLVESIVQLKNTRTIVMVAHRLSAIKSADRVVFINPDGSAVTGTHQELYANHPLYQQAVDWQYAKA